MRLARRPGTLTATMLLAAGITAAGTAAASAQATTAKAAGTTAHANPARHLTAPPRSPAPSPRATAALR